MKPTLISRPAIWVCIVTVASGVTVPSASMVIGMSPRSALAARIVCGGGPAFSAGFLSSTVPGASFSHRSQTKMASAASARAVSSFSPVRRFCGGGAIPGWG